jgi:hypothetical protein
LVRTLLGLATEAMVNDDADLAIRHLQEAAGLEPGNTLVAHLLDATELYRDAEGDARAAATDVLKSAYLTYAGELAAAGERCAAAEQIGALISIVEAVSDSVYRGARCGGTGRIDRLYHLFCPARG